MTHWEPSRGRHYRADDPDRYDPDRDGAVPDGPRAAEFRTMPPARFPDRPVSGGGGRPPAGYPARPVSGGGWPGSEAGRSRWIDQTGVDQLGRVIIDADDIDPSEEVDDEGRVNRRKALLVFGGLTAVAAVAFAPQGFDLAGKLFGGEADDQLDAANASSRDFLPGDGSERPAGLQASTNRTYADQNTSYAGSEAGAQIQQNTPQQGTLMERPQQAAAAPKPVALSALGSDPVRHLASRLTFGATPTLLAEMTTMGIDQWIGWQLEPDRIADTQLDAKLAELTTLAKTTDELRAERDANNTRSIRPEDEWVQATIARQIWSQRQVLEVMVDFWNDFLHVAAAFDGNEMVRASFDRDVIRKYALANYPDMLVAANRHPALLRYLDQDQSRKDAINENLARENLELYSVGVDGGYTEKDVRQAAILQTGRSIRDDKYVYRPDQHVVGPVTIMGFSHPNATADGGEAAAEAYFRYLALHPSTARYIALNLATRLVSDMPPDSLVDVVAKAYLDSGGQIVPTLTTLLRSTQFWGAVGQKVRRPGEYLVATYRTLGVQPETPATFQNRDANASPFLQGLRQLHGQLVQLGHSPGGQPTPNGYPDVFVAWTSAGTMVSLWNEALSILDGGRSMFSYVKPDRLVGDGAPGTAGAYVDALAQRLVHVPLAAKDRDLLLSVAGWTANAPVGASSAGAIRAVARTILASPMHHLR